MHLFHFIFIFVEGNYLSVGYDDLSRVRTMVFGGGICPQYPEFGFILHFAWKYLSSDDHLFRFGEEDS